MWLRLGSQPGTAHAMGTFPTCAPHCLVHRHNDSERRRAFTRCACRTARTQLMKAHSTWLAALWIAASGALALAGCNQTNSPDEARSELADAQAQAQRDLADAQREARERMAQARQELLRAQERGENTASKAQEASQAQAQNEYEVAVARAEATHRVAIAECETLTGAAQADCKQRAQRELERAIRHAEARRSGTG